MNARTLSSLIVASSVLLAGPSNADVFYVDSTNGSLGGDVPPPAPGSWSTSFKSLREALNLASPGDEIWIAEGQYPPSFVLCNRDLSFVIPDGVAVYGGFPFGAADGDFGARNPDTYITVLNGALPPGPGMCMVRVYHVVKFLSGSALLDGVEVRNGLADSTTDISDERGAGIVMASGTTATVRDVVIAGNDCTDLGAGVLAVACDPTFERVIFSGNDALTFGGGIAMVGAVNATFTDCDFVGNTAAKDGAGAYREGMSGGQPLVSLTWCLFKENIAGINGGGFAGYDNFDLDVFNCVFEGNETMNGNGGAIFLGDGVVGGVLDVRSSTIAHNHAVSTAGGIFADTVYFPEIYNSILYFNTDGGVMPIDAQLSTNMVPTLRNCDIEDIGSVPALAAMPGMIDEDPLFFSPTDLRPQPESCVIDNGDNLWLPGFVGSPTCTSSLPTDFVGSDRRLDGPDGFALGCPFVGDDQGCSPITDMGAFEVPVIDGAFIDGTRDGAYGPSVSVQDTPTGFGDATLGLADQCDGSELCALGSFIANDTLYLHLSGNLETNFNKIEIFIDSVPGAGQNRLRGDNPDLDFNGLNRMGDDGSNNGLTFDPGVAPDYWIGVTGGDIGGGNYQIFANWAELLTAGGGQGRYLGQTGYRSDGSLAGGNNPGGIRLTIDNSNTEGVTAASVGTPDDVTTGLEIAIPLSEIGNPSVGTPLLVHAFVNGAAHDFVSNQSLGGVGGGANLGDPRNVDFGSIPGSQALNILDFVCYSSGLPHEPLGAAAPFGLTSNGLEVFVGSSGADGVLIESVANGGIGVRLSVPGTPPVGSYIECVAVDDTMTPEGSLRVTANASDFSLDASYTGGPVGSIHATLGGELVYGATGVGGSVVADGAPDLYLYCTWSWYEGGVFFGGGTGGTQVGSALVPSGLNASWDSPVMVTMPTPNGMGDTTVLIDSITFTPAGVVNGLDVALYGKDVGSFVIEQTNQIGSQRQTRALGNAIMMDGPLHLTTANIGSSGRDGVRVDLGGLDGILASFGAFPAGEGDELVLRGRDDGLSPIGEVRIQGLPGGATVTSADLNILLGALTVEVLDDGVVVGAFPGLTAPTIEAPGGFPEALRVVPGPADSWILEFGSDQVFTISDQKGPPINQMGDSIALLCPAPMGVLDVLGRGIPEITITEIAGLGVTTLAGFDIFTSGRSTMDISSYANDLFRADGVRVTNPPGPDVGLVIDARGLDGLALLFEPPNSTDAGTVTATLQGDAGSGFGDVLILTEVFDGLGNVEAFFDASPVGATGYTVEGYLGGELVASVENLSAPSVVGPVGGSGSQFRPWQVDWPAAAPTNIEVRDGGIQQTVLMNVDRVVMKAHATHTAIEDMVVFVTSDIDGLSISDLRAVKFGQVIEASAQAGMDGFLTGPERLEVADIGSSGLDGVTLGGADDPTGDIEVLVQDVPGEGKAINWDLCTLINDALLRLETRLDWASATLSSDFSALGASMVVVEVFNADVSVGSMVVADGLVASFDPSLKVESVRARAGGALRDGYVAEIDYLLRDPTPITPLGGVQLIGDRVCVAPIDPGVPFGPIETVTLNAVGPMDGSQGTFALVDVFVIIQGSCPGDVTTTGGGNPGVPDGVTDIADLLFFVNEWDADLGTPTPNPGSIADITTTGSGEGQPGFGVPDGNVDISDLLLYVNLWTEGLSECP